MFFAKQAIEQDYFFKLNKGFNKPFGHQFPDQDQMLAMRLATKK